MRMGDEMNSTIVHQNFTKSTASRLARIAGAFYVLNIATAMYSTFGPKNHLSFILGIVATAAYIAVTLLLYFLFKPLSRKLSLVAGCISLLGSGVGWHFPPLKIHPLVFFAFYCMLIGYLILRSTFLPRFLGVLMILAGIGYTAYLWPHFAQAVFPYDVIPGAVGEWTLTVWLLVKGVNDERWAEQARAEGRWP